MLIDSHCHLDFPEFEERIDAVRAEMVSKRVTHALCVSVSLEGFPKVLALAEKYGNFFASVGMHPSHSPPDVLTPEDLESRAAHPKVVAIGETGLDYHWNKGDLRWQRDRFRAHIRAARSCGKPLIVHTREAGEDTLAILKEEGADKVGGVMHCFTETQDFATAALALNFYISFSGIVTFKNAAALREIAACVPLDKLLVETDSPYLAPVPFRGKPNHPALVRYVAEEIARLRGMPLEAVAEATTRNFFALFKTDTI